MELCDLITEIEHEDFSHAQEADFSLVGNIMNEIEIAKENPARAKLFGDARQLNDVIIEPYLRLDEVVKQEMAELYEREGCFQTIGGMQHTTRKRLGRHIEGKNVQLIEQISNYSKLIPIIRRYIKYVLKSPNPGVRKCSLTRYLLNHDINGKPSRGSNSLKIILRYDFKHNKGSPSQTIEECFQSITYGLSNALVKVAREAMELLPVRIRILENYVSYVNKLINPDPSNTDLMKYFYSFSAHDKRVKRVKDSCYSIFNYDFSVGKEISLVKVTIESLCHGLPADLKNRVINAKNLLEKRRKVMKNYVWWVNNLERPMPSDIGLNKYLSTHDEDGNILDNRDHNSLYTWYYCDFKRSSLHAIHNEKIDRTSVFESLTYGFSDELKQQVKDALTLKKFRKNLLINYVRKAEETGKYAFLSYLKNYNLVGNPVSHSKERIEKFVYGLFLFAPKMKSRSVVSLIDKLAFDIEDKELIEKVRQYSLPKAA